MPAFRREIEYSNASQALAEASYGKEVEGRNRPVGAIQGTAREYENRGNEAKKRLKTKHITFFDAANFAPFARRFAAI
jgi:hypothetical protein